MGHTHAHTHTWIHTHAHTHTNRHTNTHNHPAVLIKGINSYEIMACCPQIHTHTHTHTHTYTHTHTHTQTHTHTHTHTHKQAATTRKPPACAAHNFRRSPRLRLQTALDVHSLDQYVQSPLGRALMPATASWFSRFIHCNLVNLWNLPWDLLLHGTKQPLLSHITAIILTFRSARSTSSCN